MQLAHEVYVPSAGVGECVDEESAHVDVLDPYPGGAEAVFGDDALDSAAGDEELFEQACVEFGEVVEACEGGVFATGVATLFGGTVAVVADDGFDELADEVVGEGFYAGAYHGSVFGFVASGGAYGVAPLVAVGVSFAAFAPAA